MQRPEVAIIGAGASGIGVGKALRQAGVEFDIIEASSRFGGNWQPDGPASKMYDSAHLISSRRNTQFADYPMPDSYPDYPAHPLVFSYLTDLAEHFDLPKRTRFNTRVARMERQDSGWRLHFDQGPPSDYRMVIVCNGLLRQPKVPQVPGQFDGEVIHASKYRSSEQFRHQRVLVVGSGNSGCDIAVDAAHTASKAFHSTRRGYYYMPKFIAGKPTQEWLMDEASNHPDEQSYWAHVRSVFKLAGYDGVDYGLLEPDHAIEACHPIMNSQILYHIGHGDITPKPDISRFDGKHVVFSDGSREEIDVLLWATGYDIDLPFLDASLYDWKGCFNNLFLRMIPQEFDDLMFIGYLNTPSGIGNLANIMGRFAAEYVQAFRAQSPAFQTLRQMKHHPEQLDLGQQRFMNTQRHEHEVDLWKFIKSVNFISARLQADKSSSSRQPELAFAQ